ncbi:hypothetical protein KSP40_PGU016976 [Platanthera guangdongensis]|uniref:Uncharacterized protein n=1 Tax=Platanthera guangdongensis TaxID=2320717 RepID=A0ABR2M5U2_9ASPA
MRRVCFSSVHTLGPGECNCIRVGRASQMMDEIVDIVMTEVDCLVQSVPRKFSNLMSFPISTSQSLALPIYHKSIWAHKKVSNDEDGDNDGDCCRSVF